MNRVHRLRLIAVAAWLVAAFPLAGAFGQAAQPNLEKYGWWNANQALPADPTGGLVPPVDVPPPPGAPADGLYVEASVDGTPRAIAAVNYFTGGGVDAALTLALSDGASAEGVTLAACPAGGGWDAAQNGRWDRRPTYDPATCTFLGSRDRDTVTFRIPAAAHEPGSAYLSLALVPAEGSGAFTVSFKAPTSASLVTTQAPGAPAPTPSPSPAVSVYEPGPVTFGGPAYDAPNVPLTDVTATPTTTPSDEAAAPTRATARRAVANGGSADRVLAAMVFVAGGAALWFVSAREQRAPRLLGSLRGEQP